MAQKTTTSPVKPGEERESPPGFFRRIAAICYDTLLLAAVLFVATAVLLPINSGEAFTNKHLFYPVYLIGIGFLFYAWFWTHGGQTLGLRAWKMKVLTHDQQAISWKQALVRFFSAFISWLACGLGFFWILVSKKKLAWHDSLSQTRVFYDHR